MAGFDRELWLGRLAGWHDPASFGQLVAECHTELGSFGAMIRHGTGFWRDAWIAKEFATCVGADQVRLLHPEPFPDFAVTLDGVVGRFEATEALRPDRRRGDEFREDLKIIERGQMPIRHDPVESWLTDALAFNILKIRSDQKALKAYGPPCGLVIYLNESDYGTNEQSIKNVFAPATENAGKVFQSVDVLWKSRVHHVWRAGSIS